MGNEEQIELIVFFGILVMLSPIAFILTYIRVYKRNIQIRDARIREVEYQKQIEALKAANDAQEKERELIAKNLHDEIIPIQSLVMSGMEMSVIEHQRGKFDLEKLQKQVEHLKKSIARIRTISHELAPPDVRTFGVVDALRDYVERLEANARIGTGFEYEGPENTKSVLSLADQMNLYRLCLEILNNLIKHSTCQYIKFYFIVNQYSVSIEIVHDGKGLTNAKIEHYTSSSKGLGLKSIQSRVLLLGATIHYKTEKELASITINIPLMHGNN